MKKKLIALMAFCLLISCGNSLPIIDDNNNTIPSNATVINVVANSGAVDWVTGAAEQYNQSNDDKLFVNVSMVEAGEFIVSNQSADVWIPDSLAWNNVAVEETQSNFSTCVSVAESPLVIGMWAEVADLLAYPSRQLGWLDVVSLANDESAWKYYSGGQYGATMRMAHTNPGGSASGTASLLAMVQAAESMTEAVTSEQIEKPLVVSSVKSFQQAISFYGTDTKSLIQKMVERDPSFLSASVLYENIVLEYGQGKIIPVYPLEGTFMATHPACLANEEAQPFLNYLLSDDGQSLAVDYSLRPINADAYTDQLTAAGIDLEQPIRQFEEPMTDSVLTIQEVWKSARKPLHLVMILDTSGSMNGPKMENMQRAAVDFVGQMGENDKVTLLEFAHLVVPHFENTAVSSNRVPIQNEINQMIAYGDTALYDAMGEGAQYIEAYFDPNYSNAMMLLSDGEDTFSTQYEYGDRLFEVVKANGNSMFTIAYGEGADATILQNLANETNGQFFQGSEAQISEIYEEMSAVFGGSIGIGR